jgi:GTPase SAR1 family protein
MNDRATTPMPDSGEASEALLPQLAADVEEAASLPGIDTTALEALRLKLTGRTFNLVVAGEFKRGKTSVVNALLGADVLPTGVVPLTSIVTLLRHGAKPGAEVRFEDGHTETIALDRVGGYVTERDNPKNSKRVREVEVAFPAPWLGQRFRLIDTPGIGSAYSHNTDVTHAYLPQADAVIFVASVEQPVSQSELEFLSSIRVYAGRIFCLLNKTDYLSEAELAESVAFATAALRDALGADTPVFPVSARRALQARMTHAENAFADSGFAAFDAALRRFFATGSKAVWIASVRRHLSRLLSQCRLAMELELKAIDAPLEMLDTNLGAFAGKKAETLQARSDFEALLQADTRKLVKDRVEPDVELLKRELMQRFDRAVPDWLADAEAQHELSRHTALEQRIVTEVRAAFDTWRPQEDGAVSDAFDRICDRFQERIEHLVDVLLNYSAELFAIRFETMAAAPFRQARSRFYYKFWQEPTSLAMMRDALSDLVPGPLGRSLLLKRARRRVAELVDMQSGRVHHDIEKRIERAAQDTRRDMLDRFDMTIESIEAAIEKGRALKSRGECAAAAQRSDIEAQLARIDAIEARAFAGAPKAGSTC